MIHRGDYEALEVRAEVYYDVVAHRHRIGSVPLPLEFIS